MSDSAFNDNDPSVYKTHILYMLPTDENCNKLIRVLENHPIGEHVFYQDVSKLGSRPPWLDGVPILVDKSTSKAHKGRNIYAYVQEWKTDDFMPAGSCTGGYASFETNGEDELGDASTKKFASLSTSGVFDLEEDGSASSSTAAKQQPSSAASSSSSAGGARSQRKEQLMNEAQSKAQALMDARNMQDQRLKARAPAGGAGGGGARSPYTQEPVSPRPPMQPQQQQQYRQPPQPPQPQYHPQPPQYYQQQQQQRPPPPSSYHQPQPHQQQQSRPPQYQQPQYQQPQYQQPQPQYQQPQPQYQQQQYQQQQYQQPQPQYHQQQYHQQAPASTAYHY